MNPYPYVPVLERRPHDAPPRVYGWKSGRLEVSQERWSTSPPTHAVLYRLYTEDRPNLLKLIGRYFAGATILPAVGLWYWSTEKSVVIEILGLRADKRDVLRLYEDIRRENQQECVIVTAQAVERLDPLDSDERL